MGALHEWRERISVETPLGHGYAVLIECGAEDNWWTVILDNGAIVSFPQDRIRASRAYGYRRGISDAEMRKIIEVDCDAQIDQARIDADAARSDGRKHEAVDERQRAQAQTDHPGEEGRR